MIVIMLPSWQDAATMAALVLLGGLNLYVWARVLTGSRPVRRWARRFRRSCVLCKSPLHSMREHVTLPQAVLMQREQDYAASRTLE
jgi:hypothetical protein